MAGKVGDDHSMISSELRRQFDPVRRGAAEPVQERDGTTLAADEPAQAGSLHGREALIEPACRKYRCDGHGPAIILWAMVLEGVRAR